MALYPPDFATDEELMSRSVMQGDDPTPLRRLSNILLGSSPSQRASFMLPGMGTVRQPMEDAYMTFGGEGLRKLFALPSKATPISQSGKLAEMAGAGQIDRPWPGVYKGAVNEGRTQPLSYRSPSTFELPESSNDLGQFIERLGGKYKGPVSGGVGGPETREWWNEVMKDLPTYAQDTIAKLLPKHGATPTEKEAIYKGIRAYADRVRGLRKQGKK